MSDADTSTGGERDIDVPALNETRSGVTPPEVVRNNPILRVKVWNKMHVHNDNWMGAITGETGSGKTYAALRLAEVIDPDFSIEQVAFSVEEFLRLVMDDSYGRGSMIVFEEASVEASAGAWHETGNKVLRKVLDTWRHQNRGVVFTLPAFGALDKGARGRMSALMQMTKLNEDEGWSLAKYKWCDQDSDTGKIYKKYPRLGGKKYKHLKFTLPSEDLVEAYEQRKADYTAELNQELLEELLEDKGKTPDGETPKDDPRAIADDILDGDPQNYVGDNYGNKYIDRTRIELDYDVGRRKAKKVKVLLEDAGVLDDAE